MAVGTDGDRGTGELGIIAIGEAEIGGNSNGVATFRERGHGARGDHGGIGNSGDREAAIGPAGVVRGTGAISLQEPTDRAGRCECRGVIAAAELNRLQGTPIIINGGRATEGEGGGITIPLACDTGVIGWKQ